MPTGAAAATLGEDQKDHVVQASEPVTSFSKQQGSGPTACLACC